MKYAQQQANPIILVAETEDLVGFAWGYNLQIKKFPFLDGLVENVTYMDEIAVISDVRTKGIGTLLGNEFLESAKVVSSEVVLRTDERNTASMALFKKLGFEPVRKQETIIYDPEFPSRIYLRRELKCQ